MPKRTITACDACRQRKIRCDAAEDSCDWCKHHNLRCTFAGSTTLRSRANKRNLDTDDSTPTPSVAVVKEGQAKSGCCNEVDIYNKIFQPSPAFESQATVAYHFQDESADFLFSRTYAFPPHAREPQLSFFKLGTVLKTSYEAYHNSSRRPLRIPQLLTASVLPDRDLLNSMFNTYWLSPLSRIFPLLRQDLFEQSSRKVYDGSSTSAEMACVLAFIAFISLFGIFESNSIDYKIEVLKFLPELLVQAPTLEAVQILLILVMCSIFEGNVDAIKHFMGLASNMLFTLGGHKYSQTHARRLFWLCYAIDKEVCINIGLPVIYDSMCDLTLPKNYERVWLIDEFDDATYPVDLRLSIIKSQIFDLLYSPQAAGTSDAELLRHMRELDERLENWRDLVPTAVRPTLSVNMLCGIRDVGIFITHLCYHDCVAKIHGAAVLSPSRRAASNHSRGVTSSITLCIGACYSSLSIISSTTTFMRGVALWIIALYWISAMKIICDDRLSRPTETSDINIKEELIKSALATISDAFANQYNPDEKRSLSLGRLCFDLDLAPQNLYKIIGKPNS